MSEVIGKKVKRQTNKETKIQTERRVSEGQPRSQRIVARTQFTFHKLEQKYVLHTYISRLLTCLIALTRPMVNKE